MSLISPQEETVTMGNEEIAKALFEAFAAKDDQDVRNLCAPDLRARQNNGTAMDLGTLLGFNRAVHGVIRDFRYEDAVRSATVAGFVEEHVLRGTLPDGTTINLALCVVADIHDGEITELREYFDSASAAGLIAALR
jgi:ketosteroid isomerase-like protein